MPLLRAADKHASSGDRRPPGVLGSPESGQLYRPDRRMDIKPDNDPSRRLLGL